MQSPTFSFDFLVGSAESVAPRLLGCLLIREINGQQLIGKIVETEAYHSKDPASHTFKGRTERTSVMFGPAGFLYVYFTYGMHYCCNIVTGKVGDGSAVLIRAIEPINAEVQMELNRKGAMGKNLTNGPAKLCQALQIDKRLNGHDLKKPDLQLQVLPPLSTIDIIQTTRIGISKGIESPLRFYIKGNPYVSKL